MTAATTIVRQEIFGAFDQTHRTRRPKMSPTTHVWVIRINKAFGPGEHVPAVRGTKSEAETLTEEMLRLEWDVAKIDGEYPCDWRTAQEKLIAFYGDGSLPGRGHDTTALFSTQCQSFLDNVIAGFRPNLSLNDPCPDELRRDPGLPCIESDCPIPGTQTLAFRRREGVA